MQREIKFRVWDIRDRRIIDWEELQRFPALVLVILCGRHSEFIPMQYTGLKDKNGKEIYEADIVSDGDTIEIVPIWIVKWGIMPCYMGWTDEPEMVGWLKEPIDKRYDAVPLFIYPNTEVIGNIYKNPDLLEKK